MSIEEREGVAAMQGDGVVLLGPDVKAGEPAPDFRVVDGAFKPVVLADLKGTVCLISAVPSLDTGVCAAQTKRFNDELETLPENVAVLTISMDLPFAQKRFCDAEKIDRVQVLSDHVWREFGLAYGILIKDMGLLARAVREFGLAYGILIKDMGLLARAVFVVGKDGTLVYAQIVPEITDHPDYDAALAAARSAA